MLSRIIYVALLIAALVLYNACENGTKSVSQEDILAHEGYQILKQRCTVCHSLNPNKPTGLAPNVHKIVDAYNSRYNTLKSFRRELSEYIHNPNKSMSTLKNEVDKYGVMPPIDLTEEEVNKLTDFLYNYSLDDSTWYETHFANNEVITKSDSLLNEMESYAVSTKKVLGKNLMNAVNNHSAVYAVDFCNTRAIPLTDSMALYNNAKIKRVSDKPRNPNNIANEQEKKVIENYNKSLQNGGILEPQFNEENNMIAYIPIVTNDFCLKCHGKNIEQDVLTIIKEKYPKDVATGYDINEIRGIWVVEKNVDE